MLEFSDAPYQFFPAKPNATMQWLCQRTNKSLFLPSVKHRITQVEVSGGEKLQDLAASGARILLVANHPTHSDAQVMTEVQRQLGLSSCFMAAYDVFLRNKVCAWVMQRHGAFSIDREGSDKQSMKEAIRLLKEGEHAMTIFPEGNVYLNNDRVTPFMDGAAFVALRAQKEMGTDHPIYAVPISFKVTYLDDVREVVKRQMDEVAGLAGVNPEGCETALEELQQIGHALLTERMREWQHLSADEELEAGDWTELFAGSAEKVIAGLEEKMGLEHKSGSDLIDRIRRIRAGIHQIRIREDEDSQQAREASAQAGLWADEAILALRALTYATPYVAESPTLDRFAETTQKMREDYTGESAKPMGRRGALVKIGAPLDLAEVFTRHEGKLRAAVTEVTSSLEQAVQTGVDQLNQSNSYDGGALF